jgi:hypothetical protein
MPLERDTEQEIGVPYTGPEVEGSLVEGALPRDEYKALLRIRDDLRKALFYKPTTTPGTLTAARRLVETEEKILAHIAACEAARRKGK